MIVAAVGGSATISAGKYGLVMGSFPRGPSLYFYFLISSIIVAAVGGLATISAGKYASGLFPQIKIGHCRQRK